MLGAYMKIDYFTMLMPINYITENEEVFPSLILAMEKHDKSRKRKV